MHVLIFRLVSEWTVLPKLSLTGKKIAPLDAELFLGYVFCILVAVSIDNKVIFSNFYHFWCLPKGLQLWPWNEHHIEIHLLI